MTLRNRPLAVPLVLAALLIALTTTPAAAAPDAGRPRPSAGLSAVAPTLETPTVFDDEAGGDADADDPAIWVHPGRADRSVVIGTLKNGGLDVYDLSGHVLQHVDVPVAPAPDLEEGRFNNVDVALGVRTAAGQVDLAVVSDRGRDRIRTYRIDPRGAAAGAGVLTDVTDPSAAPVFSADEPDVEEQRNAYGLAATVDDRGVAAWSPAAAARPRLLCCVRADGARHVHVPRAGPARPARDVRPAGRLVVVPVRGPGRPSAGRGHGGRHRARRAVRRPGGRRDLARRPAWQR